MHLFRYTLSGLRFSKQRVWRGHLCDYPSDMRAALCSPSVDRLPVSHTALLSLLLPFLPTRRNSAMSILLNIRGSTAHGAVGELNAVSCPNAYGYESCAIPAVGSTMDAWTHDSTQRTPCIPFNAEEICCIPVATLSQTKTSWNILSI